MYLEDLIKLAEAYAGHRGLRLSTISTYSLQDGKILPDIVKGRRDITTRRMNAACQWFSDHWPCDELDWPSGIPRPAPSNRGVA